MDNTNTSQKTGRSDQSANKGAVIFDEVAVDETTEREAEKAAFKGEDQVPAQVSTKPVTAPKAQKKLFSLSDRDPEGRINQFRLCAGISVGILMVLHLLYPDGLLLVRPYPDFPIWIFVAFFCASICGLGMAQEVDMKDGVSLVAYSKLYLKPTLWLLLVFAAFSSLLMFNGVMKYLLVLTLPAAYFSCYNLRRFSTSEVTYTAEQNAEVEARYISKRQKEDERDARKPEKAAMRASTKGKKAAAKATKKKGAKPADAVEDVGKEVTVSGDVEEDDFTINEEG